MKSLKKILLAGLVVSMCLLAAACGKNDKDTAAEDPAEPADTTLYCPLDGAVLDDLPDRLFMVAVDNGPKSEPQTGLGQADFLFEVPVEGGINRFLAFYYHNQPDTIGPVRSARHPFIPLVNSYHGIYVHCGGSYLFEEQKSAVEEIDEKGNGSYFWRDQARSAPTNLYTSYSNLVDCAAAKGMMDPKETTAYKFYTPEEAAALTVGDNHEIEIPYTYKPVSYTWDNENKRYLRFSKGEAHMDAADHTQLYADNLIVMYMDVFPAREGDILMDMTFAGNRGEGYLFQNGGVTQIQWSMQDQNSPLLFTAGGEEMRLLAGRTIVQVVPNAIDINYNGTVPTTENQ